MSTPICNLFLSLPPTVNHYWGQRGVQKYLTARAKAFREDVRKAVESQPVRFGDVRLSLTMTVHCPDRRRRDIDNFCKPCIDAIMVAGLFPDDEQIDLLIVKRGSIVKGGSCQVEVKIFSEGLDNP